MESWLLHDYVASASGWYVNRLEAGCNGQGVVHQPMKDRPRNYQNRSECLCEYIGTVGGKPL